MNTYLICFAVLSCVCLASASECMTDAQCGNDECCFRHTGPYLVSKKRRDVPQMVQAVDSVVGKCEKYKKEGDPCWWLETANGHCGCGHNLTCRFVADPNKVFTMPPMHIEKLTTVQPLLLSKRGGQPGTVQCAPKLH